MSSYYDNILMGNWEKPLHIGCFHFNWGLYLDLYDYDKPTEYGCELYYKKAWLSGVMGDYSIFEIPDSLFTDMKFGPHKEDRNNWSEINRMSGSKYDCMDLYRRHEHRKLVVGYPTNPENKIGAVYYENQATKKDSYMMGFSDLNQAFDYMNMMIRIPFSKYYTKETIKFRVEKI